MQISKRSNKDSLSWDPNHSTLSKNNSPEGSLLGQIIAPGDTWFRREWLFTKFSEALAPSDFFFPLCSSETNFHLLGQSNFFQQKIGKVHHQGISIRDVHFRLLGIITWLSLKQIPREAPMHSNTAAKKDSYKYQWNIFLFMDDSLPVWLLLWTVLWTVPFFF